MPITVHAYSSLDNSEIRDQLERLYDTSPSLVTGTMRLNNLNKIYNSIPRYTLPNLIPKL